MRRETEEKDRGEAGKENGFGKGSCVSHLFLDHCL